MREVDYWDLVTVPRRAWDPTEGVHPAHGSRPFTKIKRVEVHWPAAFDLDDHGDSEEELASWERFHEVSKGWTDLFYNIVGDTEGDIYEGRDATVASQSNLTDTLTFLIHHGIDDDLTAEERDVFGFGIWKAWGAVDPERKKRALTYHSARASTACPGNDLRNLIHDLWDGWTPPQATGGPPTMYAEDRTDTGEFVVVRPQGTATPGSTDHWKQVIKAGHATGIYRSDYFQELDEITTPHKVGATDVKVGSVSLTTAAIDKVAAAVREKIRGLKLT